MPIVERVADLYPDIRAWRHDLHAHPELDYDLPRTSAFVAERLREFGCDEIVTGIGKTGVVGVIRGERTPSSGDIRVIGLRADMDALPIGETTNLPYRSKSKGVMHACGHDGHTAMLLGAARYLAETRNFAGSAVLIFQPAEEYGAGAAAMLKDGLIERFGVDEFYGMHNFPGVPIGQFAMRQGPLMAATDGIYIRIEGLGGHPGSAHKCIDPILVGAQLITVMEQIVAHNVSPLESAAVVIHKFHSGAGGSVIPQTAELSGTVRTLRPEVRAQVMKRLREVISGTALSTGAQIDLTYKPGYPLTFNHAVQTELAIRVARDVAGEDNVVETAPLMSGEDFGYLVEARPSAYILCGNGDTAHCHHPSYDFNDDSILYGTSFWIRLVETALRG